MAWTLSGDGAEYSSLKEPVFDAVFRMWRCVAPDGQAFNVSDPTGDVLTVGGAEDTPTPQTTMIVDVPTFLMRLLPQERVIIRSLAKTDPIVEDFMELLAVSSRVNMELPAVQQALGYLAGLGPAPHVATMAFAPERIDEILAPEPVG